MSVVAQGIEISELPTVIIFLHFGVFPYDLKLMRSARW